MINALLAIEDDTFFNHKGVNIKRLIGALIENIKAKSYKEGASTINQQVIKNLVLTSDKTMNRKVSEIILSFKLDEIYSKEQILELYLNNVLFGQNIYGIKEASLYYFNKEPSLLSLDEAATLAGIIQLPNYYNPYQNIEEAIKRRNVVLKAMLDKNFIGESAYVKAKNESLDKKLEKNNKFKKESYLNSYLDYLESEIGKNMNNVYTFLDKDCQKELVNIALNKYNHFPDNDIKVAMVLLDNNTAGIKALVGNRDLSKKVINYATSKRQFASTMKPLQVYGPLFEYLNYSPASVINDSYFTYSNGIQLKNWDNQFKGDITIRKALSESRNIPALKAYMMTSDEEKVQFLNALGLYPDKPLIEPEALGAGNNTYSLLDITSAYSVFARSGKFLKTSAIASTSGNSFYEKSTLKKQVIKESTAFFTNSILHDVFKNSSYNIDSGYLVAKTGTSNFDAAILKKYNIPQGASKDSYVIAYTKDVTFGVWVGYDNVSSTQYLDRNKIHISKKIMKHVMNKYKGEASSYPKPSNVTLTRVNINDGDLYLDPNGFYDYFIIGTEPLHYYRKKDYYEV